MEITPIPFNLSPQRPTDILNITNRENAPLRLEFSVESWDENQDGTYNLTPTDDIVFFPELVEVPPQESVIVRVGTVAPFAAVEKSYRLTIAELPPSTAPKVQQGKGFKMSVFMVNKAVIPLFLQPGSFLYGDAVGTPTLREGHLTFDADETAANVHATVVPVATGFDASGKQVFTTTGHGEYVLAGHRVHCAIDIPADDCRKASRVVLTTTFSKAAGHLDSREDKLTSELSVSPGQCGPLTTASKALAPARAGPAAPKGSAPAKPASKE
ncbi:MAG: fimbria/pilus periplasmic chaperone [Candidatus Binataceae bacterium]